jgi:hypothetical protein
MNSKVVLVLIALLLMTMANPAWAAGRKLADQELDQVVGGDLTMQALDGAFQFAFNTSAGITGNGTLNVSGAPLSVSTNSVVLNQNSISLSGNAQQNLSSMVNIVAMNSIVNVLLNLNINLPNSVVGSITQGNSVLHP